jgi:hypothetical protein
MRKKVESFVPAIEGAIAKPMLMVFDFRGACRSPYRLTQGFFSA